jgi:hypothetical protein
MRSIPRREDVRAQVFLDAQSDLVRDWYMQHCSGSADIAYIFHLTPLQEPILEPEQVSEIHWLGSFTFRPSQISDPSEADLGSGRKRRTQRLP